MQTTTRRGLASPRLAPWAISVATFAGILGSDAAVKLWAQAALVEPVRLMSWLDLSLRHNDGLFLGLVPLSEVSLVHWLVVSAAALWIGWRMANVCNRTVATGYALVGGGLAGNLLGRANGAVVDYVGFGPLFGDKWAFFNLADLALVGGAIVLGICLSRRTTVSRHSEDPA